MNKDAFLAQLSGLLADISPEEREEALDYYKEYIEDAGYENEAAVLDELGSPTEVAAEIKSGLSNKNSQGNSSPLQLQNTVTNANMGNQQNFCYQNGQYQQNEQYQQNGQYQQSSQYQNTQYQNSYGQASYAPQNNSSNTGFIVAIIIAVLLSPIWGPLLLSFMVAAIGFLIAGFAGGIACILIGIILTVIGVGNLIDSPLIGFSLIGAGLIVIALGILFLLLAIVICTTVIPWLINSISRLFHRAGHKKEAHV